MSKLKAIAKGILGGPGFFLADAITARKAREDGRGLTPAEQGAEDLATGIEVAVETGKVVGRAAMEVVSMEPIPPVAPDDLIGTPAEPIDLAMIETKPSLPSDPTSD